MDIKDFRFVNNQQVINQIKSMIHLEDVICNINWWNLIPPLNLPKQFMDDINSGRKMSEIFHVDYSRIIFGTLNGKENLILILVPVFYKDNNLTGEILFKCIVEDLKNTSV